MTSVFLGQQFSQEIILFVPSVDRGTIILFILLYKYSWNVKFWSEERLYFYSSFVTIFLFFIHFPSIYTIDFYSLSITVLPWNDPICTLCKKRYHHFIYVWLDLLDAWLGNVDYEYNLLTTNITYERLYLPSFLIFHLL